MTKLELIKEDYWNLWYFWQGTIRYWLYLNFDCLLKKHIIEQFEYRLTKSRKCVLNGSCVFCGCKTPELMFANKPCGLIKLTKYNRKAVIDSEEICYDKMLNKKEWLNFKIKNNVE
jgi:hypothetical protein